jgi:phage/plasmid-associated DNA primase
MDFVNSHQQQSGEGALFYNDDYIAPETVRGELRFKSSELYECFSRWCGRNGHRTVSTSVFKLRAVDAGLCFKRLKSGCVFALV